MIATKAGAETYLCLAVVEAFKYEEYKGVLNSIIDALKPVLEDMDSNFEDNLHVSDLEFKRPKKEKKQ